MTDRQKVINGLNCCCHTDGSNCAKCPYDIADSDCTALMSMDVLELLKEQEAVVRCKDCKHYMTMHCNCGGCFISDDWYCADGERTDNDA